MKKLLFITSELPYPARSGGKVKSLKLLHALAEKYQVTLACVLKMEDSHYIEQFHAISPCAHHLHQEVSIPRTAGNLIVSYLRGIPLNVHRTYNEQLKNNIAALVSKQDVVVLDHYEVYSYLPSYYQGLTVYHAHNAYFKIWQGYAQQPGNPVIRAAAYMESRRVKKYEITVCNSTDLSFAAPNDALELVKSGASINKLHNTFHLGDDQQLKLPDLEYANTDKKLMYVGFLGWQANSQGLLWFIEKVWPKLVAGHPDLQLDIVGKDPDQRLQDVAAKWPGITLRGFVADLQKIYNNSRVSVAPLMFGSGMKVKVLDSMARGIPTVTTRIGAEGIDAEHGTHMLIADEPAKMAICINQLLIDPDLWLHLQKNSRALITERYTWRRLFIEMHRTMESALRDKINTSSSQTEQGQPHGG
jgi:glycosyltransferase involved in cell wall biosynthesis